MFSFHNFSKPKTLKSTFLAGPHNTMLSPQCVKPRPTLRWEVSYPKSQSWKVAAANQIPMSWDSAPPFSPASAMPVHLGATQIKEPALFVPWHIKGPPSMSTFHLQSARVVNVFWLLQPCPLFCAIPERHFCYIQGRGHWRCTCW